MVREVKKMVREMEQRDCSAQREAADKEWEASSKCRVVQLKNTILSLSLLSPLIVSHLSIVLPVTHLNSV